MKNLFIMDPLEKIQVKGDSTYSLMLEAQKRYSSVFMCEPQDIFSKNGMVYGSIVRVLMFLKTRHIFLI